jgi:hypothetical protein
MVGRLRSSEQQIVIPMVDFVEGVDPAGQGVASSQEVSRMLGWRNHSSWGEFPLRYLENLWFLF